MISRLNEGGVIMFLILLQTLLLIYPIFIIGNKRKESKFLFSAQILCALSLFLGGIGISSYHIHTIELIGTDIREMGSMTWAIFGPGLEISRIFYYPELIVLAFSFAALMLLQLRAKKIIDTNTSSPTAGKP